MKFKDAAGTTFSKTLSGMTASKVATAEMAKAFATAYAKIVDGTMTAASRTVTEPLDVE